MAPTYEELCQENELLKQQIDWLKRQLFGGGKSEKIDRDQALLALGEMEARQKQMQEQEVSYTRTKPTAQRKGSTERFEKVPVTETVEIVPEEVKADPDLYEQIGAEETFEIDITPPKIFKRLIRRLKFRHRIERSYSGFYRCFGLPQNVDADQAQAEYKNGVLRITVPKLKVEQEKRKRLEVK